MSSKGISSFGVAVATFGGVLIYAGLINKSIPSALKLIAGGNPPPVSSQSGFTGAAGSVLTDQSPSTAETLDAAVALFKADKYSQLKRRKTGYSDCSSFCDKVMYQLGIPVPGDTVLDGKLKTKNWANTGVWARGGNGWKEVAEKDTQPGDIAVGESHIILILSKGATSVIGQQNSRVNVRTATSIKGLMGKKTYKCLGVRRTSSSGRETIDVGGHRTGGYS